MTTVKLAPTTMMRGRCKRCAWEFDLVALPMPLAEVAASCKQAHCPMCGAGSGDVTVAASRPLTAEEGAHKQQVMA